MTERLPPGDNIGRHIELNATPYSITDETTPDEFKNMTTRFLETNPEVLLKLEYEYQKDRSVFVIGFIPDTHIIVVRYQETTLGSLQEKSEIFAARKPCVRLALRKAEEGKPPGKLVILKSNLGKPPKKQGTPELKNRVLDDLAEHAEYIKDRKYDESLPYPQGEYNFRNWMNPADYLTLYVIPLLQQDLNQNAYKGSKFTIDLPIPPNEQIQAIKETIAKERKRDMRRKIFIGFGLGITAAVGIREGVVFNNSRNQGIQKENSSSIQTTTTPIPELQPAGPNVTLKTAKEQAVTMEDILINTPDTLIATRGEQTCLLGIFHNQQTEERVAMKVFLNSSKPFITATWLQANPPHPETGNVTYEVTDKTILVEGTYATASEEIRLAAETWKDFSFGSEVSSETTHQITDSTAKKLTNFLSQVTLDTEQTQAYGRNLKTQGFSVRAGTQSQKETFRIILDAGNYTLG